MPAASQKSSTLNSTEHDFMQREITIERIIAAPRELVFQAWIDPVRLKQWWGPKMFTNPVCDIDPRPGGKFYIVMRAPDGVEYPCSGVYREVDEPSRLVFTTDAIGPDGGRVLDGLAEVTFEAMGGKTRLVLKARASGSAPQVAAMLAGMEEGWTGSIDKLEENVNFRPSPRELVFRRLFDAPRALVFAAWSDPEQIARWWGPRGFTTTTVYMDVRPGGSWKFTMHGTDGRDYRNRIVYDEVVAPERIVYRHAGEEGDEPVRFHVMVAFEERGAQTLLTMRMLFASDAERESLVDTYGADRGTVEMLNRLAERLA